MGISNPSDQNLASHYADLGDIKTDFRNFNLMRLIASLVRGERVLDIGCGSGFLLNILQREGKKVLGIEPLRQMIDLANTYFPGLTIYQGLAEEVKEVVPELQDTIVMTDVLEHIKDDLTQLKKIYERLNPSGTLILVVPAYQLLYGNRDKNMGHYRRYSRKQLEDALHEVGFRVRSVRYWNMLGVLPYFISEKIMRRELKTSLRKIEYGSKNVLKFVLNRMLNQWFKHIENNLNLGFGLSLIFVAEKNARL